MTHRVNIAFGDTYPVGFHPPPLLDKKGTCGRGVAKEIRIKGEKENEKIIKSCILCFCVVHWILWCGAFRYGRMVGRKFYGV